MYTNKNKHFHCFRSRQYKVITDFDIDDRLDVTSPGRVSKRMSSRDDTDLLQYQRISLELMQDPDIQNMMRKSYSLEDILMLPEVGEEGEEGEDALVGGIYGLWGSGKKGGLSDFYFYFLCH